MSSIHKTNNDKIKFRNNIEDLNIHKKIKNYENKCRLLGIDIPKIEVVTDGKGKMTVELKHCDERVKNVIIPPFVDGIGRNAFIDCKELENIIIPNGIQYIGECAFTRCRKLKNISLSSGVKIIDEGAF
mgnify:FL=1